MTGMWQEAAITNAGRRLLESWAGGGTLTIDGATAGTGTVDAVALMSCEALENEKQALSIIYSKAKEGGIEYKLQFMAHEEAYTANQIGIWARLDGGERTLIAIYQDADGQPVPSAEQMPDYVFAMYATIQMANGEALEVNVDSNAFVTLSTLEEAMANIDLKPLDDHIANKGNPHGVTAAQIGLPEPKAADAGKALIVQADGKYGLGDVQTEVADEVTEDGTKPVSGKAVAEYVEQNKPKIDNTVTAEGTNAVSGAAVAAYVTQQISAIADYEAVSF